MTQVNKNRGHEGVRIVSSHSPSGDQFPEQLDAIASIPHVEIDLENPPLAAIRRLLLEAFTAQGLRRFLQDRPVLRHIVNAFGPGHGFDEMVDRVIDRCQKDFLFDELLVGVRDTNPRQYVRFLEDLGFGPFPEPGVTAPPLVAAQLPSLLAELRRVVRDNAPETKRAEALQQVEALNEAMGAEPLDLEAMEAVFRWFEAELPARSGEVLSAILYAEPLAEWAGDEFLLDFRRRFE